MAIITNMSYGTVMLDTMATALEQGHSIEVDGSLIENLVKYPELSMFLGRGRISMAESTPELLIEVSDEH